MDVRNRGGGRIKHVQLESAEGDQRRGLQLFGLWLKEEHAYGLKGLVAP